MATINNPAAFTQFQTDETRKVAEQRGIFADLYKRMDDDADLYRLKPYVYKDLKNQIVKNASNVTLNAPATFADKVQAAINGAHRLPQVNSNKMKPAETSYIERFIKAVEVEIDAQLEEMGEPPLMFFMTEQATMRGRVANRVAVIKNDDGKIELRVDNLDTRYMTYKMVRGGMLWCASFYSRDKDEIKYEYGKELKGKQKNTEVIDYWDRKDNKVWIRTEDLYKQSHGLDYVPVAFQIVPVGTMMKDANNLKYTGESIFRASRALFPELNKTATILQSLNVLRFRPPLKRKSDRGEQAMPLEEYPAESGKVVNIDRLGDIDEIKAADIHSATRLFYNALENYLQRATLPAIDFGNLSFPLSAVAIGKLTENKDQIYIPRLWSIARVYKRMMYMIIRQIISLEGEIELGEDGMKETFEYKKLQGEYGINYHLETVSPEQDVANYAIAMQATAFYDTETILKKILKEQYPEEIMDNRLIEQASRQDPKIMLFRTIHALITKADIDGDKAYEAKMLEERLVQLFSAQQAQPEQLPQMAQQSASETMPKQSMLPLLGMGGGGGGGGGDGTGVSAE